MTGPQSSQPMIEKLLGVQRCTEEDCFVFDCNQFLDEEPKQDEESSNTWKLLQQELREGTPIKIPRCYFNGVISEDITASLEGFCDSSLKAHAAVVYLRLETRDGVQLNIVASETRVAPLTKQSIPRLELLSALILARLITHIKEALKGYIDISSIRCWSDSEVALYWICGETREWKQFVQNRVLEITSLVPPRVGRYFDILIYRDIFIRDYRIEGRNLSDDISKLSSCSLTIVILLRMCT
jgi:hypothetical protein